MKQIASYIKPYALYILVAVLIKLSAALLELLIPFFMETILDTVVPAGDLNAVFLYGGAMLLCAGGCVTANILANRMSAISSGKITRKLRYDLFERINRLSSRQMDAMTVSSAESRLTSDTYNVNQFLARTQRLGIRAPILVIGGITMMLMMDAPLALVLISLLPLIGLIVYFVTKKSVPLYTKEQGILDRVVRVLQENITGIRVIKALSKTEYEKERFERVNTALTDIDRKAGSISALTNPTASLILNLGLTLVVVIGAIRVNEGSCKSGVIVAFLQYFVIILNAMLGVTRIFVVWSKGEASASRIGEVLHMPEDMEVLPATEPEPDHAHIEFRDVSFSYTGIGANLSHISFRLMPGESLGILGETGSGKSTVLNLLLRFYDPDEGQILIDGHDVRTIPYKELREKFGMVFQNDFVAEGTIEDNIRFFRDVEEDRIPLAAEDAQAKTFIGEREGGLEADVAVRGNNLSGGQKQRLLIARALASDPEILLLDDASSALDYRTDADLRRAIHTNYHRTTTVQVAQRISSIRSCDHILVLSDGVAIGYGTHDTLMRDCEAYRVIAESQMGEGKEMA